MYRRRIYALNLKFLGRLVFLKSMSHVNNSRVPARYDLPGSSNVVNVKLMEHGRIHRVYHATEILRIS